MVATNQIPAWGTGFGGVLLLLQGGAMLGWLGWRYGWRGTWAGLLVALLGLLIEYVGETTGWPFGRYVYTDLVQPKLFGVPLAICAAWMMSAGCAYELARALAGAGHWLVRLLLAATLVLLLDFQIEPVAALINGYWNWIDSGPYYGVPTANFVAWWVVGFGMAALLYTMFAGQAAAPRQETNTRLTRTTAWAMRHMPALLYVLSTIMFTAANAGRGYPLAAAIGALVLVAAALLWRRVGAAA